MDRAESGDAIGSQRLSRTAVRGSGIAQNSTKAVELTAARAYRTIKSYQFIHQAMDSSALRFYPAGDEQAGRETSGAWRQAVPAVRREIQGRKEDQEPLGPHGPV
jgi:hypothetical protein